MHKLARTVLRGRKLPGGARLRNQKSNRKTYIMTTFADDNKLKEI